MNTIYQRYELRDDKPPIGDLQREAFEAEVNAAWFTPRVDKKLMKSLMKRNNTVAAFNYGLWLTLMAVSGVLGYLNWGTWLAVPCFAIYGILYSTADHRAHELSHGTPFKARWVNEIFYHLCAFMGLHEAYFWRWSHTRHHTHTIIVGKDPEIAVTRPPKRLNILLDFFFLRHGVMQIYNICHNATGSIIKVGEHFIPESDRSQVVWSSRAYVFVFALVIAACLYTGSILPAMFVVLPRFYGGFFAQLFNVTQHAGLAEDEYDHRLSCRTIHLNPVFQWLYCSMNYHTEHHIFPMVPYHRLAELHAAIKDQCPPAYPDVWAAWSEIWTTFERQSVDGQYCVNRPLPGAI